MRAAASALVGCKSDIGTVTLHDSVTDAPSIGSLLVGGRLI